MTSQFQESGIILEAQLAELASKNSRLRWLHDEYYSTEDHANTALRYVLQNGRRCGYILPQAVKLETQPTTFMNAYAARDSHGRPLIYVNAGLQFLLMMLNYSLAGAVFESTLLAGRIMNAALFTIANGYWPQDVDLLSETEALEGFSEDERYFITAWLPSQMFFIIAHEFAHHLIWSSQQGSPQVQNVRLLNGKGTQVYRPSHADELKADEIAFEIWNELDSTLSCDFQAFTAGGLGSLFGYFRTLEEYKRSESIPTDSHLPALDRYNRLKAWLFNTGRIRSLQAMDETWAVTEIVAKACIEARATLDK